MNSDSLQTLEICNAVALHWYTIQTIGLGHILARGLVSSLDQVVFGPIKFGYKIDPESVRVPNLVLCLSELSFLVLKMKCILGEIASSCSLISNSKNFINVSQPLQHVLHKHNASNDLACS